MTELLSRISLRDEQDSLNEVSSIQSLEKLTFKSSDRKFYRSGAWYIGDLHGNQRIGFGKFKWLNGGFYEGYYENNKKHGEGVYTLNDGSSYTGNFLKDARHGYGELTWNNDESYCGQFVQDKRHGYGVYKWPDGRYFEGNFENNLKSGFGKLYMVNGDKFEGIYKYDKRCGPGIFYYLDSGKQDIGIWKGALLLKICNNVDSAFLYETLHFHCINAAGKKIPQKLKLTNTLKNSRKSPLYFDENVDTSRDGIPESFPFDDIKNGKRPSSSPKGQLEEISEELLNAASLGNFMKVKDILANGLAHPDVCDKTGYSSILGAAVNCHVDILNCLLDHGADINQLNIEGLSALSASHILLYTQHNFIDNIAENMAKENLFNSVEIDRKTGSVINRNERKMIMSIYETIHKPYMTLKKVKKRSFTKSNIQHQARYMSRASSYIGISSKCSSNDDENVCSTDEDEIDGNTFDPWKLDYYQKSMDHYKNVEEINNTFTDYMMQPYLVPNEKLIVPMPFSKDVINETIDNKDCLVSAKKSPKLFTTTAVSMFGYDTLSNKSTFRKSRNNASAATAATENLFLKHINNERKPHIENVISLLLKRGANPNSSSLPMPVLFFAIKSADATAALSLLEKNADTALKINHQDLRGLHIAVALPCSEGIEITKILLSHGADPNLRDGFKIEGDKSNDGGRTPLHIVCCREDNYKDAQKIAKLLLQNKADPDLLCCGNSALSLAIASGNDLIVDVLLKFNCNPSLSLTHGLGSILCTAVSFQAERKRPPAERMKIIDKLVKAGADLLTPVRVSDKYPPGTVVDYAYHVFLQDRRIACTPYHALSSIERECYNARKAMLESLGVFLRLAAKRKEQEEETKDAERLIEEESNVTTVANCNKVLPKKISIQTKHQPRVVPGRDETCGLRFVSIKSIPKTISNTVDGELSTSSVCLVKKLRYCYECGRSIGVRLTPCTRCKEIFYCSKGCKVKAWNERHREECVKGQKTLKSSDNSSTAPTDRDKKVTEKKRTTTKAKHKKLKSNNFLPQI